MRECDSIEGDYISGVGSRLNISMGSNGSGPAGDVNEHDHPSDIALCQTHQYSINHPSNALGNFMGISSLHGISNLQHTDVLEKLKMQVRDMKVGLMDQEYPDTHATAQGINVLPTSVNAAFPLVPTTMASITHVAQHLVARGVNNITPHLNINFSSMGRQLVHNESQNNFSFASPTAPSTKDANPGSNSSTSSETSNSSQQHNGWSFEEQYKQVRQLYEINDDPKRKEFLDDLFSFMQKRGTPINRLPIMAKSVLDLYELYNLVIARGGLVDVINKKLWQEIIKGLHLPSSITSAAFTLRTQYMKYLYPYECEKKNLSTPAELQTAIDGNRREGRRSSYGQFETMHNQIQMPQITRQSMPGSIQQMSPLALVTHAANNQQAQAAAAAAAAAHHRLLTPSFSQVPNLVTQEIEQRMIEYLKLIQVKKEQSTLNNGSTAMGLSPQYQQALQQQRPQSPEISAREALNALEMSRVALWQMYHNNTSPPASLNTSPMASGNGSQKVANEAQRSEALNLSDASSSFNSIKRERERESSPDANEHSLHHPQPPPPKRAGFPASLSLKAGVTATAMNYDYKGDHPISDTDGDEENEYDEQNTTINSSHNDPDEPRQIDDPSFKAPRHNGRNSSVHNEKSDDSAIENSPTTSAVSAGNAPNSPLSTKKIHLSKQVQQQHKPLKVNTISTGSSNMATENSSSVSPFDTFNLLSGMHFHVARNGTNSSGQQELVVNLEFNGIKYHGVLISEKLSIRTEESTGATSVATSIVPNGDNKYNNSVNDKNHNSDCIQEDNSLSHISTNINSNETMKDLVVAIDEIVDTNELETRQTQLMPNTSAMTTVIAATNQAKVAISNGSSSDTNALMDVFIS